MIETAVYIRDMRLHAYHGVLEQERVVGNDYVINVTVGYPWYPATETDDVCDTLNYAVLAEIVMREMSVPSNLLEHAAMRIVRTVKADYPLATSVSLDIRKLAPPMEYDTDGCGVTLSVRFDSAAG